ncbi:cell division protein DivIVA [Streptomyces sp. NPDC048111]|uniref:cell division protein DivIVA n=1 Tax=Streptomyces sp. NPDC048111 TaxID=3365500 RepID=UPI003718B6F1
MFWFLLIAMVVVVTAVTLAVVGGGGDDAGGAADVEPEHLVDPLPEHRPVTRADVEALRIPVVLRGYRMADVDDVLSRLGAELAERDARIAELHAALGPVTRDRQAPPAGPDAVEAAAPARPDPAAPGARADVPTDDPAADHEREDLATPRRPGGATDEETRR